MDYYNIKACSNSALTALKNELSNYDQFDYSKAFIFGSLVDALITEPDKIDFTKKTIEGQHIDFVTWNKAYCMYKAFINDNYSMSIIAGAKLQHVTKKEMTFNYEGFEFMMLSKCKWDFFGSVSGDIKTTMAKTQKEFEKACEYMEYYRGRAFYMDLEKRDVDVLIGISKVNFKIFYKVILRGDENYLKGKNQYTELAMKYYLLKYQKQK